MRTKKWKSAAAAHLCALAAIVLSVLCVWTLALPKSVSAEDSAPVLATVFGFNRLYDAAWGEDTADKGEYLRTWNGGPHTLTADKEGAENEAVSFIGGEYGSWQEGDATVEQWGSTNDTYNGPTLSLSDYKSAYVDFYVGDYTKVRLIQVNIGTSAANSYEMKLGTVGVFPIKQNGWQRVQLNLSELKINGTLPASAQLSLHVEVYHSAESSEVRLAEVGLSTAERPVPAFAGFEFNEFTASEAAWDGYANGTPSMPIQVSTNEAEEAFSAWLIQAGSGNRTLNYKLTAGELGKANAMEFKVYVADITKLEAFRIELCYEFDPQWKGYMFNLVPAISQNGWNTVTIKFPTLTNKNIAGMWLNTSDIAEGTDIKLDYMRPAYIAPELLETCDTVSASNLPWNGLNIVPTADEQGNEGGAWGILGATGDDANSNAYVKYPGDRAGYNAIAIRLKVDSASAVKHFYIKLAADNSWAGVRFNISGRLVNGWQTVYVPFGEMAMEDNSNNPLESVPTGVTMMNLRVSTTAPIVLDEFRFVNLPVIELKDSNVTAGKDDGAVDLKAWYNLGNPSGNAVVSYEVKKGAESIAVADGVFTADSEGVYTVKLIVTDNGYRGELTASYTLDKTAPTAENAAYVVADGRAELSTFFTVADNFSSSIAKTYAVTKGGAAVLIENGGFIPESGGEYVVSVTVTDEVGNSATYSRTVTFGDIEPPVLTVPAADVSSVSVNEIKDLRTLVSATDNVSADDEIAFEFSARLGQTEIVLGEGHNFSAVKGGTYVITVKAIDRANNFTSKVFHIVVADTVRPVIELSAAFRPNLRVGEEFDLGMITATDDVDGALVVSYSVEFGGEPLAAANNKFTLAAAGSYTVTASATDNAGNSAQRTITVNAFGIGAGVLQDCISVGTDSIMWNAGLNFTLTEGAAAGGSAWKITTNQFITSNAPVKAIQKLDLNNYNVLAIRLFAADSAKVTKLKIRLVNATDGAYAWYGYQADIDCSALPSNQWTTVYVRLSQFKAVDGVEDGSEISGYTPGTEINALRLSIDTAADLSIDEIRLELLPAVEKNPQFASLSKDKGEVDLAEMLNVTNKGDYTIDFSVALGDTPVALSGTVFDAQTDGVYTVTAAIGHTNGYRERLEFLYTLDTTAPTITNAEYAVSEGMEATVANFFSITDALSEEIVCVYEVKKGDAAVDVTSGKLTLELGEYTVKVTATDKAGNSAAAERTVTVADSAPPTVTVPAQSVTSYAVGQQVDLSALVSASDNVSAADSLVFEFTVKLGISAVALEDGKKFTPSKGGNYIVTVVVRDEMNNASAAKSFTVAVADTVAPVIGGLDGVARTGTTGNKISLAGISAADDVAASCTLDITVTLNGERITLDGEKSFTPSKAGTYTVTVVASDGKNEKTETFDIVIENKAGKNCGTVDFTSLLPPFIVLLVLAGAVMLLRKRKTA